MARQDGKARWYVAYSLAAFLIVWPATVHAQWCWGQCDSGTTNCGGVFCDFRLYFLGYYDVLGCGTGCERYYCESPVQGLFTGQCDTVCEADTWIENCHMWAISQVPAGANNGGVEHV
jgi:hypothetical protein